MHSPLKLIDVSIKINKPKQTVTILTDAEYSFINPFVIRRLEKEYNYSIETSESDLENMFSFLNDQNIEILEHPFYLGNFHHHRHEVLRELEQLLELPLAPSVEKILGNEEIQEHNVQLVEHELYLSDIDQLKVFEAVEEGNTVIQGPPGTGKSQVLTNLVGKILHGNNSALVVSEKRVALDVIRKKLSEFELEDLCFITTGETHTLDLLYALKISWDKLEKEQPKDKKTNLLGLSDQICDQIQFTLDVVHQPELMGGISYDQFQDLLNSRDLSEIDFNVDLPDMNLWLSHQDTVSLIFEKQIHNSLKYIQAAIVRSGSINRLGQQIEQLSQSRDRVKQLNIFTWEDLQIGMKKAAYCQLFESPVFKKYQAILTPGSKEQKKFHALYAKYIRHKTQLDTYESMADNWIIQPGKIEVELLESAIRKDSLFSKWKNERLWKKYSIQPFNAAPQLLSQLKKQLKEKELFSAILVDFCGIGVDDVSEIEFIHHQIHQIDQNDLINWQALSVEERSLYADANAGLNELYHHLKSSFVLLPSDELDAVFKSVKEQLNELVELKEELKSIPDNIIRNLRNYSDYSSLELAVLKSNQTKTFSAIPQLRNLDQHTLLEKLRDCLRFKEDEARSFALLLRNKRKDRFEYYHTILRTSASKLSNDQKELKAKLKKGKSILVKEFSKSKSFPSIRELFQSEAKLWIQCLKPLWMSNPSKVASTFPLEQGMFDYVIFDEASQIPLSNAIGTLQRGLRVIIAGDQQQMGPSHYFKAQDEEVTDLLHQASYYWQNIPLKHHYRSEHPDLIRFSNRHFYQNELVAFPSSKMESQPILLHKVEGAVYNDRINPKEAEKVAALIQNAIKEKDSLGIVAFSEAQLECIYHLLDDATKLILEDRIEKNTVFFKALENVQGEECDTLIVSFGYGYSEDGEFHMRFGPVNQKNGPKRLNVLFTRAKKRIHWVSSVSSKDFKLSSNEGVDLLRLFYLQMEQSNNNSEIRFPYSIEANIQDTKVKIPKIHRYFTNAKELATFISVCQKRGWTLN